MTKRLSQSGQTISELVITLGLLVVFVPGALLCAYLAFSRLWINYHLEQSVLCIATREDVHYCQRTLDKKISRALVFGKWRSHLSDFGSTQNVEANFQMNGGVQWHWQKQLNLEEVAKKVL